MREELLIKNQFKITHLQIYVEHQVCAKLQDPCPDGDFIQVEGDRS